MSSRQEWLALYSNCVEHGVSAAEMQAMLDEFLKKRAEASQAAQ